MTRALLLLYLALTASLDLHHNHGGPQPAKDPAILAVESCGCGHPCPVDLFQNAHGPALALALPQANLDFQPLPFLPAEHPWPGGSGRLARPRGPPLSF